MSETQCPHRWEWLPNVADAFCPYCRESLDESSLDESSLDESSLDESPVESFATAATIIERQPLGSTTLDVANDFPSLCVLCGSEAQQCFWIRFHREHSLKKSLLKFIVGGGLFGGLIADEVFDEKPIDCSFPVCDIHISDRRLGAISGTPVGRGRVAIAGIHPVFVTAVNELSQKRWADLAQRMDNAEN